MKAGKSKVGILLVAGLLTFLGSMEAWAQLDTGTIVGTVRDQTGAVIPGATVKIINVQTGRVHETSTNKRGSYVVPALPVSTYRVEVEAEGFKKGIVSEIILYTNETVRADAELELGGVAEEVTVVASRMQVETESAEIATTITERQVNELPLNGRDFTQLATLTPGSVQTGQAGQNSVAGFETFLAGINILLDGADATRIDTNATSTQLGRQTSRISRASIDSIEEFQILKHTYSAEYGRSVGAVVNAITKSGGNEFHGALFEFFRNNRLDARNFFDQEEVPVRLNQFGGNLSGPIFADKLFFFVNYEGVRQTVTNSTRVAVLNESTRNTIAFFSPSLQPVLDAIPLGNAGPNPTVDPFLGQIFDDFIGTLRNELREDTGSLRIDWIISEKDSFYGRYNISDSRTDTQFGVAEGQIAPTPARNQLFKLSWKHTFSATALNDFGFAINRVKTLSFGGGGGFPIIGCFCDLGVQPGPALFSVLSPQTSFTWQDTFSKVTGRHDIRAGFDIRRNRTNRQLEFQDILTYGNSLGYAFNSAFAFTRLGFPMVGFRNTNWNFFIQDNIRVAPGFQLNLGLRYEYNSVIDEENDQISNFSFSEQRILPPGEPFYDDDKNNFAPRIGFAWDPWKTGETVLRGGFGIFYNPQLTGAVLSLPSNNFPNFTVTIFDVLFGVCPATFPLSFPIPDTLPECTGALPPQNVNGIDPDLRDSYSEQWTLSVQQEVIPNTVLELAYVGIRGLKLPAGAACAGLELNNVDPVTGTRPLSNDFANERFLGGFLKSSYNALQASLRRRVGGGLNFDINYTWSHELDNCVSIFGAFQDSRNIDGDYGDGDIDVRHTLTTSFIYDVPAWQPLGKFGQGWQLTSIMQFRSGFAVNVVVNPPVFIADPLRPDPVPGQSCRADAYNPPDVTLNPAAFTLPAGQTGLLERNACRGPSFAQVDLGIIKNTSVTERVTIQFRTEIFNLFNEANFANPNSVLTGPNFGRSNSTINNLVGTGTSRQIQFALKLLF